MLDSVLAERHSASVDHWANIQIPTSNIQRSPNSNPKLQGRGPVTNYSLLVTCASAQIAQPVTLPRCPLQHRQNDIVLLLLELEDQLDACELISRAEINGGS